jgi:transcriptional regulator with XRE-family HTH domain
MPARSKEHAAFGQAVKEIREQKGLTQAEVAERMDAPATFVSDIERAVRNVSLSTLIALSKALGVKLSDIAKRAKL